MILGNVNNERRLYEELVLSQLSTEDWSYAEDLAEATHGALQPFKLHATLGYLVVRKKVERGPKDGDGRSIYRKKA